MWRLVVVVVYFSARSSLLHGVGHVTAPCAEHALAVGLVFNSGNCSPSEDEAAEQAAAGSSEEGELTHLTLHLR